MVGAAMPVYNELGSGFLEAVNQKALEIEMGLRGISFEPQKELVIFYKERCLRKTDAADFLAYGKIIVEIKAHERLTPVDKAQLLHYLKATKTEVGILINFGSKGNLEWKRLVKSRLSSKEPALGDSSQN